MNKISFIIICFLIFNFIQAQNLVVNPSFETVSTVNCVLNNNAPDFNAETPNWTAPVNTSPDIMDVALAGTCFSNPYGSDPNAPGPQTPRTGNRMAHQICYANNTWYREIIQVNLSSALDPTKQYLVEFYVSLADNYQYASNAFEVLFTTSEMPLQAANANLPAPQLTYSGTVITDKTNWTLISFTFSPTAAYTYFQIGNISKNFTVVNTGTGSIVYSGYYIDDVSVTEYNPMPVEMIMFNGITKGEYNKLTWATASETNNDYFTIEKSLNAELFLEVDRINGVGNSNYEIEYNYDDYNINDKITYYRIKQTDFDGKYSYSKVISVNTNALNFASIYPNPSNGIFEIFTENIVDIAIINMSGKLVLESTSNLHIDISDQPKGLYFLRVFDNNKCFYHKIMIE